jgi:hypothetical protein
MTDRITIVDRQDHPRYLTEGDQVRPHPDHVHVWAWFRSRCRICNKTRKQVIEESE